MKDATLEIRIIDEPGVLRTRRVPRPRVSGTVAYGDEGNFEYVVGHGVEPFKCEYCGSELADDARFCSYECANVDQDMHKARLVAVGCRCPCCDKLVNTPDVLLLQRSDNRTAARLCVDCLGLALEWAGKQAMSEANVK